MPPAPAAQLGIALRRSFYASGGARHPEHGLVTLAGAGVEERIRS